MKQEIAQRWTAALRSGKFDQTKEYLHRVEGGYCCLGVLCELAVADGVIERTNNEFGIGYEYGIGDTDRSTSNLPRAVAAWAGMIRPEQLADEVEAPNWVGDADEYSGPPMVDGFVDLNDTYGATFSQIADIIDGQWDRL